MAARPADRELLQTELSDPHGGAYSRHWEGGGWVMQCSHSYHGPAAGHQIHGQVEFDFNTEGGFTVVYPAKAELLKVIRDYQDDLREHFPQWSSMLEFNPGELRLKVFPVTALPSIVFSPRHYGRR